MGKSFNTGLLTNGIAQDSSNNIGIGGAANASYKLAVTGTGLFTGALTASTTFTLDGTKKVFLRSNQGTGGGLISGSAIGAMGNFSIYSDDGVAGDILGMYYWNGGTYRSALQFANVSSGSSNLLLMKDGGNVGIGTSSPTAWNGNQGLLVSQTGTGNTNTIYSLQSGATSVDTGSILEGFSTNTTSGSKALGSIVFLRENTSTTALSSYTAFYTNNAGTVAERMRITSGGAINIKDGTLTGGGGFEFTSEAFFGARFQSNAYKFMAGNNSTEYMRITSGGDVGIGGSISGQKLYVKAATANGSTNAFLIHDSNGSDLLFVRSDGLITTGGAVSPYNFNPGGRVMYVNSSGQVGSNPSTRESKININPISDVSYIYDLNPVSFYFRKTNMETYEYTDEYYDEIRYGFIADEVEPLNTDLVSYNVNEDGSKKMAGVEYISMIPVLVKALQEQKKLIEELSAKVTALENK